MRHPGAVPHQLDLLRGARGPRVRGQVADVDPGGGERVAERGIAAEEDRANAHGGECVAVLSRERKKGAGVGRGKGELKLWAAC